MSDKDFLTHDQIEAMNMSVDEDGNVYATSKHIAIAEQYPLMVFGLRVAPPTEFSRLLATAPMLYQCVTRQTECLGFMLRDLERLPNAEASHIKALREMLEAMRKLATIAQDCAIKGFESGSIEADSTNRQTN